MRAQIYRSSMRVFDCFLLEKNEFIEATALGNLLKKDTLVPGDFVTIEKQSDEYVITELCDRDNEIYRRIQRERKKKVIASNIDMILIVTCAGKPTYKRGLVERYIVRAKNWDIPVSVIFNKMDLYSPENFSPALEYRILNHLNIPYFEISTKDQHYLPQFSGQSFNDLKKAIKNKTTIVLGHSGVGKSSLINALSNGKVDLDSREIGKVGKGTHTTTWAELVDLGHCKIIDSPGVRSMSLDDLNPDEIDFAFDDIVEASSKCQFKDCTHQAGQKGCYFRSLDNTPESQLLHERLESYLKIMQEVQRIPHWQRERE